MGFIQRTAMQGKRRGDGMKKIACVVPPFYRLIESKNNRLNLGLHYLAEILHQKGYEVLYINGDFEERERPYADRYSMFCNSWLFLERYQSGHESFDETVGLIKSFAPDCVVISAGDVLMPTVEVGSVKSCAYMANVIKREISPDIACIGYGHLLKYASDQELHCLDTVITGEGEDDILSVVENGTKGKLPEKWLADLDRLPILKDTYLYRKQQPEDWDYIMSRRGCGYQCAFCQQPGMRGNLISVMSPQRLKEELQYRMKVYGTMDFYFCDPIFVPPGEPRSMELLQMLTGLKEEAPAFTWRAEARITSAITREFLRQMKQAGCRHLKFGIEMLHSGMLSYMNKNINYKNAVAVIQMCREMEINTTAYVLLGCPGFCDEDYREMWYRFRDLKADNYVVNITIPYVGTRLYRSIEEELREEGLYRHGEPGFFHLSEEMQRYWKISDETLKMYFSLQGRKDDAAVRTFEHKVVDRAYYDRTGKIRYLNVWRDGK